MPLVRGCECQKSEEPGENEAEQQPACTLSESLTVSAMRAGAREAGGDLRLGPGQRGGSRGEGAPPATAAAAAAARTASDRARDAALSCSSDRSLCIGQLLPRRLHTACTKHQAITLHARLGRVPASGVVISANTSTTVSLHNCLRNQPSQSSIYCPCCIRPPRSYRRRRRLPVRSSARPAPPKRNLSESRPASATAAASSARSSRRSRTPPRRCAAKLCCGLACFHDKVIIKSMRTVHWHCSAGHVPCAQRAPQTLTQT